MKYPLILIIALFIGIGCALPNILGYLEFKQIYEPFSWLFPSSIIHDEITIYAPFASYFKERFSLPFEIDIYEYRNHRIIRYFLPSIIEGTIGYLFKDLRLGWGIVHFIFPVISFLLVYLLVRELTEDTWVACFTAVVFCTLGFGPRTFLNLNKENMAQPVLFSRLNSPAATLPFLIFSLIGLIKINKRRFKIGILLSGIFGGLLFYTYYFYHLIYALMLISLILVYSIIKKWNKFFSIFLSGIIANIIAIPCYILYFNTLKISPAFISHWLDGWRKPMLFEINIVLIFIILLIIGYLLWKTDKSEEREGANKFLDSGYFPVYMLILISILMQFIISQFVFLIAPTHFLQYITNGFTILVISCIIGNSLIRHSRIYKIPIIVSFCILIILLFIKQINLWQYTKNYFQANPKERTAEELVYKHTNYEDVIGISNPYLNSVFSARLWRFKFYAFFVPSSIDRQENLNRYLFIQKMFNQSWDQIDRQLRSESDTISPPLKTVTVPYLLGFTQCFSEKKQELKKFYESLGKDFLNTKRLNYLVCLSSDEEKNLLLGTKNLGININLIAKIRGVSLYKKVD